MDSRHCREQARLLTRLAARASDDEVAQRLRMRAQNYLFLAADAESAEGASSPSIVAPQGPEEQQQPIQPVATTGSEKKT
jgi:hypothetical protein